MFLWLHKVELAMERVKLRVEQGGHSIPPDTIVRRYKRGLENFFSLYMPIVDNWWLYDNSGGYPGVISKKLSHQSLEIFKIESWNDCKKEYI